MRLFIKTLLVGLLAGTVFLVLGKKNHVQTGDGLIPQEASLRGIAPPAGLVSKANSSLQGPIQDPAQFEKALKKFRSRFGNEVEIELGQNGRLVRVTGKKGSGERAFKGFSAKDGAATRARAGEILSAARELMAIQSEFPLGEGVPRPSDDSAKVYFQETYDGLPLAPFGHVSVDLGPEGELLGIDSDYLPDLHIENEMKISAETAKTRALAAVASATGETGTGGVEGGGPLIWVPRAPGPTGHPIGRYAYQYSVDGIQVIIDGTDGKVLFQRSRRQY